MPLFNILLLRLFTHRCAAGYSEFLHKCLYEYGLYDEYDDVAYHKAEYQ